MRIPDDITPVTEVEARAPGINELPTPGGKPFVVRDLAANWPLVETPQNPVAKIQDYLLEHYNDKPVTTFFGQAAGADQVFYDRHLSELNFKQEKHSFRQTLTQLNDENRQTQPRVVYMGSTALDYCFPGVREHNSLALPSDQLTVRLWLGNRTAVSAHYDVLENIACVCAGRRQFMLFPPEQISNLYIGPLDFTPAGQSVSLVNVFDPDLEKFPRSEDALEQAQFAELGPGDAIFIPAMWWHSVRATSAFNLMINHWWREVPTFAGPPADVLLHALLSIRTLPHAQRQAWKALFSHYIFDADEQTVAHIPTPRRGILGDLDTETARRVRAQLRNSLNR